MLYDPKWAETVTPPVIEEPWRKLCSRAAEVIRTYGWVRHKPGNEQEGFCVIGALLYASCEAEGVPYAGEHPGDSQGGRSTDYLLSRVKVINTLHSLGMTNVFNIPEWNDRIALYPEDAIKLLELAALSAE